MMIEADGKKVRTAAPAIRTRKLSANLENLKSSRCFRGKKPDHNRGSNPYLDNPCLVMEEVGNEVTGNFSRTPVLSCHSSYFVRSTSEFFRFIVLLRNVTEDRIKIYRDLGRYGRQRYPKHYRDSANALLQSDRFMPSGERVDD
jgi:hypothetical protein